jgi:hypothetical protein
MGHISLAAKTAMKAESRATQSGRMTPISLSKRIYANASPTA